MMMGPPEKPKPVSRQHVLDQAQARQQLREGLSEQIGEARIVLHPRYQWNLWVTRKKQQAAQLARKTGHATRKAAPVMGVITAGTLIFLARKPISKWISHWRDSKSNKPQGE